MNKGISIGIIALFIVSAVSPMVIGFEADAVSEIAIDVKTTIEAICESRYGDFPIRYKYISKDGQIRTVTKSRSDFMAERTQYYEEDLPIISANVENCNHPPIIIDGNDDFTSENGVTGGNGTEEDPYIIEDWIIEGGGSNKEGIFIMNTDAYFVIRNCTANGFYGSSSEQWGSGIRLSSVENGRIEDSTTFVNQRGICVDKNSAYIEIVNCSCGNYSFNFARGILCDSSQHISIISTECHDTEYGLILHNETSYVLIKNSSFYNNYWDGILGLERSRRSIFNHTIKNCKVYNNVYGGISIHVLYDGPLWRTPGHILITNCKIYDNGIPEPLHAGYGGLFIGGLHDNIIENCTIYHNGYGIGLISCTNNIIRNLINYDGELI